jgi:hypothetical protein
MIKRSIAVLMLCFGAVFVGPLAAQASDSSNVIEPQNTPGTAADGWQSANCTEEIEESGEFCSPSTPNLYYKKAGGHPKYGFTQYIIQHEVEGSREPIREPKIDRTIKTLHVELPAGLTVDPLATARCPIETFKEGKCGTAFPASQVGYEEATLVTNIPVYPGAAAGLPEVPGVIEAGDLEGTVIPPLPGFTKVPVYGLVPNFGEPALNGFIIAGTKEVFLETDVAWQGDYHESFTIKMPEAAPQPDPPFSTLVSRQVSFGTAGNGTYITNPTTCLNPEEASSEHTYSTYFKAESYGEEDPSFPSGTSAIPTVFPEGLIPTGCRNVPFDPEIVAEAGTAQVDSPAPASVETTLPVITGGESISESHLRNAKIVLPAGMGLNPAATSQGLTSCSDAQFKQSGSRAPVECPAASKIGTVAIETPPIEAGKLKGDVYLGEQLSRDPTSGNEFRIFIDAEAPEQGISVRLIGKTKADPVTGQVTTEIDENPQTPFESVTLHFDGANSVLTSPPTCATAETTSTMEPWSTPASTKTPSSTFTLSSVPGGGSCPQTLAQRKFAPSYTAATESTKAGAYSPFRVRIGRPDGQQEVKLVNVTLPKGLTGNLSGIPYCSEAALTAAAENSGKAELAGSSCPAASQVGTDSTESGTGATPVKLPGKVFLAGPYQGAPLSLAAITPAVSGPFDLGTVVVRVALNVNPETAQINAVSDSIPDVFGGVKLDIRTIDFNLDRAKFMLNPTNCAAQATSGAINGAGGDATDPAAWSSYAVSAPFQASECDKLGFKPKLHTRLYGPTTRGKNPRIRAILEAGSGEANVSRTALNLPHSLFLDQSHIKTVCTRVQLAAQECPSAAVYGHAEAKTPLLSKPLKGPVYLVSSSHTLPDLVADLRGQVNVQLHGVISSKHAGLKTVFASVPDVPVKKFILNMQGGKKSLLVNSTNTCKKKQTAVLNIKGQNGKKVKSNKYGLNISSCGGKSKH